MLTVDANFLKKYIQENKRHKYHDQASKQYSEIKVHSDGECPGSLLTERRPGESEYIFAYRKKIYQPKTKNVILKVCNTLDKIRRSSDWSQKYDDSPKNIYPEETLQKYCESNYPEFASLTKWLFDVALKQHVVDPNAVVLIKNYKDKIPAQNEFAMPYAVIFNSDRVIDYVKDELAVLLSEEKSSYIDGSVTKDDGDIFYVATPTSIYKISQASSGKDKWDIEEHIHNIGVLPAFQLGGRRKCEGIFESRISGMIPSLNVAVTIYSDKQAEIVQHVHSEKWIYQTQPCTDCSGQGKIPMKAGVPIECPKCKGMGVVNTSPYSNLIINANSLPLGEKQVPIPPAGFIQKTDVALMVEAISKEIRQEIWDAYSAVNMEFLMETPMAESGVSKELDRDELNNFVYGFAEDLVSTLDRCYYLIALMRYSYLVKDRKAIKEMCPKVAVPEKFDLLSSNYYLDKYKSAREAKVNPLILSAMETEYAVKEFYNNPEIAELMLCVEKLNPLAGMTEDEKMTIKSNGGTTEKDYIISCNITSFVKRAIEENEDFFSLKTAEQKTIISAFADEIIKANSTKEAVLANQGGVIADTGLGKVPLAIQQLSLAMTRAKELGDVKLVADLKDKTRALIDIIDSGQ